MARSIDDWYADSWASGPERAGGEPPKLPRRPVGATRLALFQPAPDGARDGSVTVEVQAAIQRIRAADPGIGARKLARRLRDRGWPAIALGEVRALLARTPAPRADQPGSRPRIDQTVGPRYWPVRQRTLICGACGVAVSVRGLCRCP